MDREQPHSVLIDQAAQMLGVSRRTVYYRIRQGRLVTIRTKYGSQRVLLDSVEELLRDPVRRKPSAALPADADIPAASPLAAPDLRA